MRNKLTLIVMLGLVAAPMAAQAVPVTYELSVTNSRAIEIPGFTGRLTFDAPDFIVNDRFFTPTTCQITAPVVRPCGAFGLFLPSNPSWDEVDFPVDFDVYNGIRYFFPNGALSAFGVYSSIVLEENTGTLRVSPTNASVPEPGTLALLGLGLAGLGVMRRKRAA